MSLTESIVRQTRQELDDAIDRLRQASREAKAITRELNRLTLIVDSWANTLHDAPKKRTKR
jgi:hypothetical protein